MIQCAPRRSVVDLLSRASMEHLEPRALLSAAFDLTGLTQLRADPLYSAIDGQGIGVAVLDSGVYSQHPLLAPNFRAWYDATALASPLAEDQDGHGTHVSGTIGATSPDIGVANRVSLIGVRVIGPQGSSETQYDSVANGLQWVLNNRSQHNIRVVNMSLGYGNNANSANEFTATIHARLIRQLEQVGITVVTASGNSYGDYVALGAAFPAVVSTINVGSVWEDAGSQDRFPMFGGSIGDWSARADQLSSFSQRSTLPNQVFAPGQTILSTWNNAGGSLYNTIAGTSMAAPFVSGLVALMQDAALTFGSRYLSPSEVLSVLKTTADTIVDSNNPNNRRIIDGSYYDLPETGLSYARVNARNAVARVRDLVRGGSATVNPADLNRSWTTAAALGAIDGTNSVAAIGAIDRDGANTPGASDIDFYKVEIRGGGDLVVRLSPVSGSRPNVLPMVKVFWGSTVRVMNMPGSSQYPTITITGLGPGDYYIAVAGFGNNAFDVNGNGAANGSVGDYQFSAWLNPYDYNGTFLTADEIELPLIAEQDAIGSDGSTNLFVSDVDVYSFTPIDDGEIRILVQSDAFGFSGAITRTYLFTAGGQLLASLGRDPFGSSYDYRLDYPVLRGQSYRIVVTGEDTLIPNVHSPFNRTGDSIDDGEYVISVVLDNNDINGSAFKLIYNNIQSPLTGLGARGVIGSDPSGFVGRDGRYDVDFYRYVIPADGLLDLQLSGDPGFTPTLRVWKYDPIDDDIYFWAELPADSDFLTIPGYVGEEFYVAVSAANNVGYNWYAVASGSGGSTGWYTLTPAMRPFALQYALWDDEITASSINLIQNNQAATGRIGTDGGLLRDENDVDFYRFVPSGTAQYAIRAGSTDRDGLDTTLRIFDDQGNEIAFNDDQSSQSTDSLVTVTLTGGRTYFIGVSSWSPTFRDYSPFVGDSATGYSTGAYGLSITGGAPLVRVTGNRVAIANNDTTPTTADWTSFGGVAIDNFQKTRVFTIWNDGTEPLVFAGAANARIQIVGAQASSFIIVAQPTGTVAPGANFKLRIRLDTAAAINYSATVRFTTNSATNSVFQFAIRGVGTYPPQITVAGGAPESAIALGDQAPSAADGTEFGAIRTNTLFSRTFVIGNTGINNLNISNITFSDNQRFGVSARPTVVVRGQHALLTVWFNSSSIGRFTSTITVLNSDPFRSNFTFVVGATVI